MFTFIDLFAGIGGIRQAFQAVGGCCVFTCEYDKYAQQTYSANFDGEIQGDIRGVREDQVPDHDVLLAGFPCPAFSSAGVSKRNSMGRKHGFEDETQGTLFFDVARIIKAKQPKAFFLENVKNLMAHDKGNTFKIILRTLRDELGYTVFSKVIDARTMVPQHRERTYIVGFKHPTDFYFPEIPDLKPRLRDILENDVSDKYTLSDKMWQCLIRHSDRHKKKGNGFGFGLADLDGVSRTMLARYYKDGSEILIPQEGKNPRKLTPRECARLMGFEEDFIIPTKEYCQIACKQYWHASDLGMPYSISLGESLCQTLIQSHIAGSKDATEGAYKGSRNFACYTTSDGKSGAIPLLDIHQGLEEKKSVKSVIGLLDKVPLDYARSIITQHENGAILSLERRKKSNKDFIQITTEATDTYLSKLKQEEDDVLMLWRNPALDVHWSQEKLYTILTSIKRMMPQKIFGSSIDKVHMLDVTLSWSASSLDSCKKGSLSLSMGNTNIISETRAYKQFGNSVVVPIIRIIAAEIAAVLEHGSQDGSNKPSPPASDVSPPMIFV